MRFLLLLVLFWPLAPPLGEKLVLKLPDFYKFKSVGPDYTLTPPSSGVYREYWIDYLDIRGRSLGAPTQVTKEEFYEKAEAMLSHGVRDTAAIDNPYLNEGYLKALKQLYEFKILSHSSLLAAANYYRKQRFVESAFWLDEAFPGKYFSAVYWKKEGEEKIEKYSPPKNLYKKVLAEIKLRGKTKKELNKIRTWLDSTPQNFSGFNLAVPDFNDSVGHTTFVAYGKSYSLLVRFGADFTETSERNLLYFFPNFMNYRINIRDKMAELYELLDLPIPSREIMTDVFSDRVNKTPEAKLYLLKPFMDLMLKFPPESAEKYSGILLKYLDKGNLEYVGYFLKNLDYTAINARQVKRYGDDALDWHGRSENRKLQQDSGNYYRVAVICYLKIKPKVDELTSRILELKLKRRSEEEKKEYNKALEELKFLGIGEEKKKKLLDAYDDFSVQMSDLLIAYELAGHDLANPKTAGWLLPKLEKRISKYRKMPTGIYFRDCFAWRRDRFGKPLVPFREEVALTAYLGDLERAKKLAEEIADYSFDKVRRSHPAYLELEEILDLYEYMEFKGGAQSLAQALFMNELVLPARRAFHIAGLGEEAERKYYRIFSRMGLRYHQEKIDEKIRNLEEDEK